jgi:prephenate dehydrogenase
VAGDPSVRELAAGSFRDLTRVAASDPGFWPEVLIANRSNVAAAMDGLIGELEEVRASLLEMDENDVEARLGSAQLLRRELAPPIVSVRVLLQDKPGEIAAVGRALEESSVDVRDLQLRHAIHGGGGVLTLAVRPGEAEPLRAALAAEGFQTE